MKELTLDLNVWRCGGIGHDEDSNQFGKGNTELENVQGYMCCLGQFTKQINPRASITGLGDPAHVKASIEKLNSPPGQFDITINKNTQFSIDAMNINDGNLNLDNKIKSLKKLCKKNDFVLKIKNDELFDSRGKVKNSQLLKNELYEDCYIQYKLQGNTLTKNDFLKGRHFWRQYCKKRGWKQTKIFLKKLLAQI